MTKQKKRNIKLPMSTKIIFDKINTSEERDDYVRALRIAGWTLASISDVIGLSRERVRQICTVPSEATKAEFYVPEPPRYAEKVARVYIEPKPETLSRLLELQPMAQRVRSSSPRFRAEAEEYTSLLNHAHTVEGVTLYRLGKRLGITHSAIRFRLTRYGYKPMTETTNSRVYQPLKNRVIV